MYVCCCLPDALPLHPGYLDKRVVQDSSLHFSPNSKNCMHNKQQTENYVHALTLRLPEPVWIGSPLETTGFHRKFINGPKSQQLT